MYLEIHGARGSMPVGTADFGRIGGDTTCYTLHHDDGSLIVVIDAGTGLRLALPSLPLGQPVPVVFTHYHWDHIQGLSGCVPLWAGELQLRVIGPGDPRHALTRAISPPTFPVNLGDLEIEYEGVSPSFRLGEVTVTTTPLYHPQGGVGYRFDHDGSSVMIATDHEAGTDTDRGLVETARGADVFVMDTQYLPSEYPQRTGWGHSTWKQAVDLSRAAGARHMVAASHDPSRTDPEVEAIVRAASDEIEAVSAASSGSRIATG